MYKFVEPAALVVVASDADGADGRAYLPTKTSKRVAVVSHETVEYPKKKVLGEIPPFSNRVSHPIGLLRGLGRGCPPSISQCVLKVRMRMNCADLGGVFEAAYIRRRGKLRRLLTTIGALFHRPAIEWRVADVGERRWGISRRQRAVLWEWQESGSSSSARVIRGDVMIWIRAIRILCPTRFILLTVENFCVP